MEITVIDRPQKQGVRFIFRTLVRCGFYLCAKKKTKLLKLVLVYSQKQPATTK